MLPTFFPPTIWAISLEFYRKLSILAADDLLGACYRKAMTPKKLWTLLFPQLHTCLSGTSMHCAILLSGPGLHDINCFRMNFVIMSGCTVLPAEEEFSKSFISIDQITTCRRSALQKVILLWRDFEGANPILSSPRVILSDFFSAAVTWCHRLYCRVFEILILSYRMGRFGNFAVVMGGLPWRSKQWHARPELQDGLPLEFFTEN